MKLNIIFVIIIIVLGLFLVFGHNGLLKYQELSKIRASYEDRLAEKEKKIDDLSRELSLVRKDRDYLKMVIKKQLNMKEDGEDLYIIEKKPATEPQKSEDNKSK